MDGTNKEEVWASSDPSPDPNWNGALNMAAPGDSTWGKTWLAVNTGRKI